MMFDENTLEVLMQMRLEERWQELLQNADEAIQDEADLVEK